MQRVRTAVGRVLNFFSRRTLTIVTVLGAAVPAYLLKDTQQLTSPLALGWIGAYVLLAVLWLRDATTKDPTASARSRMFSRALAATYGIVCGLPILAAGADRDTQLSLAMLATYLSLAAAATALKHPLSGIWFVRLLLGVAFASTVRAGEPLRIDHLAHIAFTWGFAEILSRRAAFLREKFLTVAARHHEATNAVRSKARELEETTSSRIRILGTVSHEIRQPIHALGMMVERLRIDPASGAIRDQIDEIGAVVRSLAQSLALLLDISRLDAGTVKVKKTVDSIHVLLDRVKREFAVDAKRKGLKFECHSDLNVRIETDIALFYGALANFVSNAIRYTDRGHVKVYTSQKNNQEIWLHVADTGRGIPAEKIDDVFKEYVRIDRENQSAQGFGLGLAIVKRTAQLLALDVQVDSKVGEGSEFRISVPCTTQIQVMAPSATTIARPSTVSRSLVGLRVVLVDNDESVLRGIDSMARSWGCVPLSCQSVAELAEKLQQMPGADFDCVVADYHLGTGEPNGLDAIEVVRKSMTRFVSATLFTGDLNIRSADLRLADVHVAHKPVVPARICVMFEEMAAETKRRRPGAVDEDDTGLGDLLDEPEVPTQA